MFRAPLPTNTATLSGFSSAPLDDAPLSGAKHPDTVTRAARQTILTMFIFFLFNQCLPLSSPDDYLRALRLDVKDDVTVFVDIKRLNPCRDRIRKRNAHAIGVKPAACGEKPLASFRPLGI